MEMMSDGGGINEAAQTSSYYSNTTLSPLPALTRDLRAGISRNHMVCGHRDERVDWYEACDGMELGDIWWTARYIMKRETFSEVSGEALDVV